MVVESGEEEDVPPRCASPNFSCCTARCSYHVSRPAARPQHDIRPTRRVSPRGYRTRAARPTRAAALQSAGTPSGLGGGGGDDAALVDRAWPTLSENVGEERPVRRLR